MKRRIILRATGLVLITAAVVQMTLFGISLDSFYVPSWLLAVGLLFVLVKVG